MEKKFHYKKVLFCSSPMRANQRACGPTRWVGRVTF